MEKISRRSFLERLAWASSAVGAVGLSLLPMPGMAEAAAIVPAGAAPHFKHPEILRYDAQCFTIHGKDAFLYSACMHYPRTPKALWRDRLVKLKQAGFNTIETYVFWNYHEPVEGQVDMSELADYLKLIHQLGLWAIVRVGPYVCAEWDAGGFPHWLIEKQFPLRSDSPESVQSSKDWYGHVLPVVRENMITRGGPVILVQIENEYDFWRLPNENKLKYMTVLANTAWSAGIDVPLITNWCKQARENTDPVMARLADTCDFYPRWNIVKEVVPELKKLRDEEPASPVGIAELQGGWFSQFGGKLSVDQVGMGGDQLNMLTRTVMEAGTTYLSFYMAHGGTNFDWAARRLTTTYDYAAPVREPGGLWEKYYAARRIGAFLDSYAPMILRSQPTANGVVSSNARVSATMRGRGQSAIVFVRENADAEQAFKLKISDPSGTGAGSWSVPRHGNLAIGPRGMKMLAVNWPIGNGRILYCTAEFLAQGRSGSRSYIVLYDDPGSPVEIALLSSQKPEVKGSASYVEFDPGGKVVVIGFVVEQSWKSILVSNSLQIVVLPRDLAGRTWTAELPASLRSGVSALKSPVITDCVLMRQQSAEGQRTQLTLEYASGAHSLTILTPRPPTRCAVDGSQTAMEHDSDLHATTIQIETTEPDTRATVVSKGEFWVDDFSTSVGKWQKTAPVALEKLGQIPYGYVKYSAGIDKPGNGNLWIEAFTEQKKVVFLNGRHLRAVSNAAKSASCRLAGLVKPGKNLLEISYEAFGSANFGKEIEDLTGIRSIRIGDQPIGEISLQRFPAGAAGHKIDPEYVAGQWRQTSLLGGDVSDGLVPAFTWFRAKFSLRRQPSWFLPRKLVIESSRDALLYLNGNFVGNYQTIGPQSEFYLPEPYLYEDGRSNVVTVMLAYTNDPRAIRKLVIEPYGEFRTRRTEVRFDWDA